MSTGAHASPFRRDLLHFGAQYVDAGAHQAAQVFGDLAGAALTDHHPQQRRSEYVFALFINEHHAMFRRRAAEQRRHLAARLFDRDVYLQFIHVAARWVAELLPEVGQHGFQHPRIDGVVAL